MVEEKKENKLEGLSGKCIVKDKGYNNYYYGGASYGSEFSKAIIFDINEIPDYIKNNPDEEIIHLDSERGLELVINEVKRLEHYIQIEKPHVEEAEKSLDKLYNFDLVQKWVELHNKWYNDLIGISQETEDKITKEVLGVKA